jgi:hypothetical protein
MRPVFWAARQLTGPRVALVVGAIVATFLAALGLVPRAEGAVEATWSTPQLLAPRIDWEEVACTSSQVCVGAGAEIGQGTTPDLVLSTNPTVGSSWQLPKRSAGGVWEAFACPSASLCLASLSTYFGTTLYASRNPAQGRRSFKQVAARTRTESGRGADVSCAAASFCAEIEEDARVVRFSNDPGRLGSWHAPRFPPSGALGTADDEIACASSQLCLAYATWEDTRDIAVIDNPLDPSARWIKTDVDPEEGSREVISGSCNGISCLSEQLTGGACEGRSCLLTTGYGAIISSEQADGGASTWSRTRIYGTRNAQRGFYGLSSPVCFSTGTCYILGAQGDLLVSTAPFSANPSAWEAIPIPGKVSPGWMDCPSPSLCYLFRSAGRHRGRTSVSVAHIAA